MNRLTYEELIEDLTHKQVVAMTHSAAFTGTIHGRRVDVYPLGFFVFDECGELYTLATRLRLPRRGTPRDALTGLGPGGCVDTPSRVTLPKRQGRRPDENRNVGTSTAQHLLPPTPPEMPGTSYH